MTTKLNTAKPIVRLLAVVVLLSSAFASHTFADQNDSLLNFKFSHLSNNQNEPQASQIEPALNNTAVNFEQYDATWTYPWETKNINIGLGVTLRHLSGVKSSTDEGLANSSFQTTLPLMHASALFSLPLQGLSAGIEGSHLDLSDHQVFDYRAKVSYEWRKGFGMQGGWQHQQFNLNNAAGTGAGFEKNGPFIDLYLNF